jgi:hypothetical protein
MVYFNQLPKINRFPGYAELILEDIKQGNNGLEFVEQMNQKRIGWIDWSTPGLNEFCFDINKLSQRSSFIFNLVRQDPATVNPQELLELFATVDYFIEQDVNKLFVWFSQLEKWEIGFNSHFALRASLHKLLEISAPIDISIRSLIVDSVREVDEEYLDRNSFQKVFFPLDKLLGRHSDYDFSVWSALAFHYKNNLFATEHFNSEAVWSNYMNARILDLLYEQLVTGKDPFKNSADFENFFLETEELWFKETSLINSIILRRSQKIFERLFRKDDSLNLEEINQQVEKDYLRGVALKGFKITPAVNTVWG